MKKLILLAFIITMPLIGHSQIAVLVGIDTLKGADTITITTPLLKFANTFIGLEAQVTDITGTSTDDYMIAQASATGDATGYATLNTVDYNVYAAQNDTVQISDDLKFF